MCSTRRPQNELSQPPWPVGRGTRWQARWPKPSGDPSRLLQSWGSRRTSCRAGPRWRPRCRRLPSAPPSPPLRHREEADVVDDSDEQSSRRERHAPLNDTPRPPAVPAAASRGVAAWQLLCDDDVARKHARDSRKIHERATCRIPTHVVAVLASTGSRSRSTGMPAILQLVKFFMY